MYYVTIFWIKRTIYNEYIKLKSYNSFDYKRIIEYIESYSYTTYVYSTITKNKK